jgi:hypothetical protein
MDNNFVHIFMKSRKHKMNIFFYELKGNLGSILRQLRALFIPTSSPLLPNRMGVRVREKKGPAQPLEKYAQMQ